MRASSGEEGFVLPVVLLVMVLLTIIAVTALYSARSDFRAARDAREAAVALAAADAGAARTVALWSQVVPSLPAPGDSLDLGWETLPDDSRYRVVLYRAPVAPLDPPPSSVVMYTTGRVRPPGDARRSIAVVVEPGGGLGTVDVCCDAAVKVTDRLDVNGSLRNDPVPEVDGTDRAPPTWSAAVCPASPADVAGVTSSNARNVREGRNGDIEGAPPVEEDPSIVPGDFTDLGGGLTYGGLAAAAGSQLVGNQTLSPAPSLSGGQCDETDPTNWGSPLLPDGPCGDYLPLIHVAGDLRLTGAGQGQGMLLVDGDLTIEQDASFHGVIIVLGTLDMSGAGAVHGGIMVRGNANGSGRSSVGGTAKIQYSSCAVTRAQEAVSGGAGGATEREWFEVIG